jgi:archaemetzincin
LNSLPGHTILISPIGDSESELYNPISREVSRIYGYPTEVMPLLQDVDFAFDAGRNQYYSTMILETLAMKAPSRALKTLAITHVDLFIPVLTHVYGEAQLGGKTCIISIYRLKEGLPAIDPQKVFLQRVVKEAIHELGHTFNLRHCPDHTCLMHYCRSERDVDQKSDDLCRHCKVLLEDELKKGRRGSHPPALRSDS